MRASTSALAAVIAAAASASFTADAFTPTALAFSRPQSHSAADALTAADTAAQLQPLARTQVRSGQFNLSMATGGFLGQDDEDEEEDDDEEEEDDEVDLAARRLSLSSATAGETPAAFAGLKLDPYDPNPSIKPRPGRYGFRAIDELKAPPDDQLLQAMSSDEREENLKAMRQIKNHDLADLRLRKDHAGWVEANNDLKKRQISDPWFGLNDRLREAYQLGDEEEIAYMTGLIKKIGGPPPGIKVGPRGYALHTDIYDIGMSTSRQASVLDQEIIDERVKRHKAMAAETRKNEEAARRKFEDKMRGGDNSEEKEAKERRERMMARLMGELEEDKKKREDRAKEQLGKIPDMPTDIDAAFQSALKEAQDDVKSLRRRQLSGDSIAGDGDENDMDNDEANDFDESRPKSSAAKAREKAAQEASGGRPRLPGDQDVTIGEITIPIESSSEATTGPIAVEVSSSYNTDQSDPPMRKHCFQYTIRITNNSPTDTIQLLSRRFEIQTVGSSTKDVVQGEGVTGRQPTLKPGEVFEYTSTAPLSVRPIGTTYIAARMKGEYRYVTLSADQETATAEQVKTGGDSSAELGVFHFVFPEEQRVKPVQIAADDDDEDEDDAPSARTSPAAASSSSAATGRASPSSTLPGDTDMEAGDVRPGVHKDLSDLVTDGVRVRVTTSYKPERSDPGQNKHCFQYNIRITNESSGPIQLVSRRFEIQTIGSSTKDVVQGPGVTGRQPILKPGESFEYNSTAPLSVRPILDKTPVVARMEGEYNFVQLGEDGTTPVSSTPLQARLGKFHFILPDLGAV